ncbi:MAG: translation initiation factor 2 [Afipia sp.]|nr:translation initiation factor 2 [Afipia sp.]
MRIFEAIALSAILGGCASVTRGWDEQIAISSTPSGVEAKVTGLSDPQPCITPCSVKAKRNDEISITFEKEGYEPQVVNLTREIAGTGAAGFAGNILLGGVVGGVVDAASGAALDHKPNPVIVTMKPLAPSAPPPRARPRKPPQPVS